MQNFCVYIYIVIGGNNHIIQKQFYCMRNKRERLNVITEMLKFNVLGSQEEMLEKLAEKGYHITQATLSRDLKTLKVAKTPLSNGLYKYVLPSEVKNISKELTQHNFTRHGAVVSVEFSGHLAVLKTRPGYASAIALDVDNRDMHEVLGTIAGDDTVLLIPRDGVSREELLHVINQIFNEN